MSATAAFFIVLQPQSNRARYWASLGFVLLQTECEYAIFYCYMKKITSFSLPSLLFVCLTLMAAKVAAQNISDSLHVVHYDLSLDMTDFGHRSIGGYADLTLVTETDSLGTFTLDLQGLTVDSVQAAGQLVSFSRNGHKLAIPFVTHLGDTTNVRVYYHGTPVQDSRWGGFYYSGNYCYNMGVAFENQPHNFGRCWFPCLDVFTDKSTYTMHIRTEAGKMAVCGGMLADSATNADGSRLWTWQLEQPIPTYLASVAVGPYRLYQDTFQGIQNVIPITIYAQPNTIAKVQASFVHLKEVLRAYESWFGPYLWPRVGYVAVNFTSGAMEHATNIAYPNAAIDGTLANETLYAHELFHLWFGDLITCSRAEEMWLNEGFASYAEALTKEALYGAEAYRDYIRDVHRTTLKDIVKDDGGHYALDNVPQEVTYGTHSYQKGALIVHTLRHYMGDSLFFNSCKALLNQYAFQNITTQQFFQCLAQNSGMVLEDFYQGWVHQPGFLHFSIDSVVPMGGDNYRVHLRQKLSGATHYADRNKLDLTFVSQWRELFTAENVMFSGETGTVEVSVPFVPVFAMVDYHEKMADATIDYTEMLVSGERRTLGNAYCTVQLDNFADTVLVRVEHNMAGPDCPQQLPDGIDKMSDNHYWNINMAYRQDVNTVPAGTLQFKFMRGNAYQPDQGLFDGGYTPENLKLLYRQTTADPWQIMPAERGGSSYSGYLKTDMLLPGQYVLAVGDPSAGIAEQDRNVKLHLTPNPASDFLDVSLGNVDTAVPATIYDTSGKAVKRITLTTGHNRLKVSSLSKGVYILNVTLPDGSSLSKRFAVN